jgi:nucleoid DNA-binding protein
MLMKSRRKASSSGRKAPKPHLTQPAKVPAAGALRSKSEVFTTIAERVGIGRRDVADVFHVIGGIIKADLSKKGPGVFKLPGLLRISIQQKPASPARLGINPFTKQEVMFKAKPARNVVKVRPLRALREMV